MSANSAVVRQKPPSFMHCVVSFRLGISFSDSAVDPIESVLYSHPSNIYILIKVLNPGGVAVFWGRPLCYRLCLPSRVGGDMRM